MNFALLGTSLFIEQLESQIAKGEECQTVFSRPNLRGLDFVALEQSAAQMVVVDGVDDETEFLRGIEALMAFDGVVLVVQLCNQTVLTAYEVERLARDAVGYFAPFLPLLQHPALVAIRKSQTEGGNKLLTGIGQIERVEMQRAIQFDSPESVLDTFTQDIALLVALTGSIKEVVAMRMEKELIPLNVQCTSQNSRLVRWSAVRSSPEIELAQILIEGTEGRAIIRFRKTDQWDLETGGEVLSFSPPDLVATCTAINQQSKVSWIPMTHSLEVREAIEKSLQRGRLVRLNLDGHGERTAFKGTMASLGCGLLIGGLFVLIFSAAILSVAPAGGFGQFAIWIKKVPWVLAGLMVLFLLIQLLAFVIPSKGED